MFGELSGKILSTPTPYEILRTVNVERDPFETRRMHTPSNAWRRVFSPSRIFAQTLIESPGRNSGRVAWRRWLFSIESRIRWALMATSIGNGPPESNQEGDGRRVSTGEPRGSSRYSTEESVQEDRAGRPDREVIPVGG